MFDHLPRSRDRLRRRLPVRSGAVGGVGRAGQERHLIEIAKLFDQQVRQVSQDVGNLGETRLFLMGALLLADEMADLKLRRNGEKVEANASRCPATMAALELAPMPRIDKRSPIALWSLLKPGTHIQPHHGLLNTRLI
eukprot:gene12798-17059_t